MVETDNNKIINDINNTNKTVENLAKFKNIKKLL